MTFFQNQDFMNYQFNFKFLDFVEVIFLIFIENKNCIRRIKNDIFVEI